VTLDITRDLVEQIRAIALLAGQEIMTIYNSDFAVDTKADASPVTEADRAAENLITPAIRAVTDAWPVIAEEAAAAGEAPALDGGPFWLVDPLDGTKQFVSRRGEFTVNIGLIDDGVPVLGVVHAPAIGATYWGSPLGAFAETDGAPPRPITVRRQADDGLVVAVSRSHRNAELDDYLATLRIKEEITSGSSIKFCMVAAGRADLYPRIGRTMEWDTAAGHAVVRAAGGHVNTLDGRELTYGKPGFENPNFIVSGN
jgi:3'(2'), 5'-bisphosphate nucleotidase